MGDKYGIILGILGKLKCPAKFQISSHRSLVGNQSVVPLPISEISLRRVHTKQNLHNRSFVDRAEISGIVFDSWRIHATSFSVIAAPWKPKPGDAADF